MVVSFVDLKFIKHVIPLMRKMFPQLSIHVGMEDRTTYRMEIHTNTPSPKGKTYHMLYRITEDELNYLPLPYIENRIIEQCVEVLKHHYKEQTPVN